MIQYRKATLSDLKKDLLNFTKIRHRFYYKWYIEPWIKKIDYCAASGIKYYRWQKYTKGIPCVSGGLYGTIPRHNSDAKDIPTS